MSILWSILTRSSSLRRANIHPQYKCFQALLKSLEDVEMPAFLKDNNKSFLRADLFCSFIDFVCSGPFGGS